MQDSVKPPFTPPPFFHSPDRLAMNWQKCLQPLGMGSLGEERTGLNPCPWLHPTALLSEPNTEDGKAGLIRTQGPLPGPFQGMLAPHSMSPKADRDPSSFEVACIFPFLLT
ncbi:hypothetical protein I79_002907 [Cricetulus griseus]|uniref:Uncharacterized protein n=1 Tax=Cricetulus griseus TaxID=10029 RepID=G3GYS9_CRIGR|nr:hypothetical protein I79_002907 [Cricetulus griseus]